MLVLLLLWNTMSSQLIQNYEGSVFTMNLLLGGSNDQSQVSVVNNPSKTGINTSNRVCRFLRDKDGVPFGGFFATVNVNLSSNKYVHMKVYKTRFSPLKFKLQGPSGSLEIFSSSAQTKVNQWEDIVFNFSSISGNYNTIVVMPDFSSPVNLANDIVIYIDDIILNNNPNPATYVDELFQNTYLMYRNLRFSNGVFLDALAMNGAGSKPAGIASSGVGLAAMCIAHAMWVKTNDNVNWQNNETNVANALQTFINFKNNGKANAVGMFPRYFVWDTGNQNGSWSYEYSTIDNAIFAMGVIMCKNYFINNTTIVSRANNLLGGMNFTKAINSNNIATVLDFSGNNSLATTIPFSEYMMVAWLAKNANPANPGYNKSQTFWNTYFANPDNAPVAKPNYFGYEMLSDVGFNSSFIPQFCYYFVSMFKNSGPYMAKYNNWKDADKLYAINVGVNNTYEWGLGAGEIPGGGYSADKIDNNPNQIVSPHIIAGFLPINAGSRNDLLNLYNNGNGSAVYSLPSNTAKKVLWRYKRSNTGQRANYIQAIDYCSMLFGLASLPENLGSNWISTFNVVGSGLNRVALTQTEMQIKHKSFGNVDVYPMPFSNNFNINISSLDIDFEKPISINIFDLSGKVVYSQEIERATNTLSVETNILPGQYILEVQSGESISRKKIIKLE